MMNTLLLAIEWNASPEIVSIGSFSLRWYGILFALGFLLGLLMVTRMFKEEGAPEAWLDKIFLYMVLGTVIGARLGHVFFYDWDYYSAHLSEIPKVWEGGLASHGGAIGIILALWYFSARISKRSLLWILDKVVVPTALAGCFIRLGNLMNSEIIGNPSDASWAFIFKKVDDVPRHPVQLYEAISYLFSFALLYYTYWKTEKRYKQGYIFGLFLVLIFGFRIIMENFKDNLGGLEEAVGNSLSTGQLLSIPFVLIGLYYMFRKAPATTQQP